MDIVSIYLNTIYAATFIQILSNIKLQKLGRCADFVKPQKSPHTYTDI